MEIALDQEGGDRRDGRLQEDKDHTGTHIHTAQVKASVADLLHVFESVGLDFEGQGVRRVTSAALSDNSREGRETIGQRDGHYMQVGERRRDTERETGRDRAREIE